MSLPESGSFIKTVRTSCAKLAERSNVQVTDESIRCFLTSISEENFARLSQSHGTSAFPLSFPTPISELNLLSTLALLNFGSSFRAPLHAVVGRGTYDTIRFFVLSAFISDESVLTAKGMRTIGEEKVAELMGGLPLVEEKEHETLKGVTVGTKGGRPAELVASVVSVLNSTGRSLTIGGWDSLGALVANVLEEAKAKFGKFGQEEAAADLIIERLVSTIPGFEDTETIDGEPVYLFKKAFFLLHTLSLRYPASSGAPFTVPSTTSFIPAFVDNVLPTLAVHLSLLTLPPLPSPLSAAFPSLPPPSSNPLLQSLPPADPSAPKASTPAGGPVLATRDATVLRAATLHALERATAYAREGKMDDLEGCAWMKEGITESGLDGYLWAGGKDRPDWRKVERFVCDSIYY